MSDSNDVGKPTGSPDAANISKQDEGNTTVTDSRPRQPAEELLDEPDLLNQAREFLSSPAIRPQSVSRKREFLLKKGLSPEQTEKLLEEADVCQSHTGSVTRTHGSWCSSHRRFLLEHIYHRHRLHSFQDFLRPL